jgi:RsiW-degrading membrane proteinase PrsW (M82 family)
MYDWIVILVSVLPGIAFLLLIMRMDRQEPEPLGLVIRVMCLGAGSAVVASLAEAGLDILPVFGAPGLAATAMTAFVQVAPVEELCKLGVVLLFVWRNPHFNEENDGIVYVGASAIGFAMLENVIYVAQNGIGTGIVRAFTAIPLHVFTAVVMGLYAGRARFAETPARRTLLVARGFAIAWFFHGLYDLVAMSETGLPILLLPVLAGLLAFGVMALKRGRRLSLVRWGGMARFFEPRSERRGPPRAPRWMPVISRMLLAGGGLVWMLLILGLVTERGVEAGAVVLGGLIITFLPLCVGLVLEVVYRRLKRRVREGEGLLAEPPG